MFVPTETVTNNFSRRVALSLEYTRAAGVFFSDDQFLEAPSFRGGGPHPEIGVATSVVTRKVVSA